ncbi:hypothetical protein LCGC14_0754940 [marine sediment metagenome]|uniref:CDC48 N-terminal subdomain domain-containing protein n=1 Tax=marine sediment metagenome TaxID=412755 RepID=A0A0F9QMS5_9ZZZZ|nr:hypothetical protein [archaeon]HEC38602.1 hypothetical protein [bacterium]
MNTKRLKIRDAYKEDAGRGRIRIDSIIIKELNLKSGDTIEIFKHHYKYEDFDKCL